MLSKHVTSVLAVAALALASSPALAAKGNIGSEAKLGDLLYHDTNLSAGGNQSCASCHTLDAVDLFGGQQAQAAGVDPENVATGSPTSRGSLPGNFGGLNAPAATYAAFSPTFYFDDVEGLWIGGQFWNGRAATLEEQAKGPFLNPLEMAMPSRWAVIQQLQASPDYVNRFDAVYGIDLAGITAGDTAAIDDAYEHVAAAIATFERTPVFNKFNSKFDYVLKGLATFTAEEQEGFDLFKGKAQCNLCHVLDLVDAGDGTVYPPVFTDFTYDNIGVPRNHGIPGDPAADIGLGATTGDIGDDGKHKVMTLRNIAVTAPYSHNGYFRSLDMIVHFYNTRDVAAEGWAPAEVATNVNGDELGNLGLTPEEEAAVVAFMKTLTDGYGDEGIWPDTADNVQLILE